jgi:hypothetical protein
MQQLWKRITDGPSSANIASADEIWPKIFKEWNFWVRYYRLLISTDRKLF